MNLTSKIRHHLISKKLEFKSKSIYFNLSTPAIFPEDFVRLQHTEVILGLHKKEKNTGRQITYCKVHHHHCLSAPILHYVFFWFELCCRELAF